jgi:hypothetical protein
VFGIGLLEPSDQSLAVAGQQQTMRYPVAIDAYDGEVGGIIIPVIPIDMVKVDALIGACHAASLADMMVGVIQKLQRFWTMSVEYSKYALAFERLSIMFLAVERRTFAQWLRTHRALFFLSRFGASFAGSIAFPYRTAFASCLVFLGRMLTAPDAHAAPGAINMADGVLVNAKLNGSLRNAECSLQTFNDRLPVNLHPTRHVGSPRRVLTALCDVHVGTLSTSEKAAELRAFLIVK